jgi:glycosyltransferase involved in cell wall biosynthesis
MVKLIKFSVVIPFGGNADLLVETVDSIFNQSYQDWDLTIIDDGTTVDLEAYLYNYLDQINLIVLPKKIGIVAIFDLAIDTLAGEIGMILGADDVLHRDFFFHMANAWYTNPEAALIHPRVITINRNSDVEIGFVDRFKILIAPTNFKSVLRGRYLIYTLISGNWMYFTSSTFKISQLKEWRFAPDLKIAMDWDLALRMSMGGKTFAYSKDAIFYYRRHSNSFSMNADSSVLRLKEELAVMKKVRKLAKKTKSMDIWFISLFHFYSQLNFLHRKIANRSKHQNI